MLVTQTVHLRGAERCGMKCDGPSMGLKSVRRRALGAGWVRGFGAHFQDCKLTPHSGRGVCNSFYKLVLGPAGRDSNIRLVGGLVLTFAFLLHKVQDGDRPIRAPQEPSDAFHHPFHFVLFFRSHPARTGRRGRLGRIPPARSGLSAAGSDEECRQHGLRNRQAPGLDTTNQLT